MYNWNIYKYSDGGQGKQASKQMHTLKYAAFWFYFSPIESKYLQSSGTSSTHWQKSAYMDVSVYPKLSELFGKNGFKEY